MTFTQRTSPFTQRTSRNIFPILSFSILALLSFSLLPAREPARTLEDLHAASCRILAFDTSGRGAVGTGTICGVLAEDYCILTNWHVIGARRSVRVQFFGNGQLIESAGTVIAAWHDDTQPYDFALITVPISSLTGYEPPYVPLADPGVEPAAGETILSCGCPEGRWPMAWKGHIDEGGGDTFRFIPAPKEGQSGSAIVQRIDGKLFVTGILTWRIGDERRDTEERMRGGAIPIRKLYDAYRGCCQTRGGSAVPPGAKWCAQARYAVLSVEKPDQTAAKKTGTAARDGIEVLFFTQSGCIPCREAEAIVQRYVSLGYAIRTIDMGSGTGYEEGRSRSVSCTPTFIVLEHAGGTTREITRFTGVRSLEERLARIFSGSQPPAADLSPIFDPPSGTPAPAPAPVPIPAPAPAPAPAPVPAPVPIPAPAPVPDPFPGQLPTPPAAPAPTFESRGTQGLLLTLISIFSAVTCYLVLARHSDSRK